MPNITLTATSDIRGDCTASYAVETDASTVGEFVEAVLKRKEWGHIGIASKGSVFGDSSCEYKHGTVVTDPLSDDVLGMSIESVEASGGYSYMSYLINIEYI